MSPEGLSPHAYEAFGEGEGEGLEPEALKAMGGLPTEDVLADAKKLLSDLEAPKPPVKKAVAKPAPSPTPKLPDGPSLAERRAEHYRRLLLIMAFLAIFIGGGATVVGVRLMAGAEAKIAKLTADKDKLQEDLNSEKGKKTSKEIERVFVRVLEKILNPTALRDLLTLIARYSNPETRGMMPENTQDAVRLLIDHLTKGANGCQLDDGIEDRFSGPGTPGCTAFTAFLELSPPLWRFFNTQPEALARAQALLDRTGFTLNGKPNTTWDSYLHQNRGLRDFELPPGHEKTIISYYAAKGLQIPQQYRQYIDADLVKQFQAEAEQR